MIDTPPIALYNFNSTFAIARPDLYKVVINGNKTTTERRDTMIGFHITVPRMKQRELINFVKCNIPTKTELIRRAKLARLPRSCKNCGATIGDICDKYGKIPTSDWALRFPKAPDGNYQVMQLASGQHACRQMKEGVSRIIHEHLQKKLKDSNISHLGFIG